MVSNIDLIYRLVDLMNKINLGIKSISEDNKRVVVFDLTGREKEFNIEDLLGVSTNVE